RSNRRSQASTPWARERQRRQSASHRPTPPQVPGTSWRRKLKKARGTKPKRSNLRRPRRARRRNENAGEGGEGVGGGGVGPRGWARATGAAGRAQTPAAAEVPAEPPPAGSENETP